MDQSDQIMSMSALVSALRAAGRKDLSADGTLVVRPVTGSYLFRIEQFKRIQKMVSNDTMITSPTFRVGGHDWFIRCYPNGREGFEGFISFYLEKASHETGVATADFHMSILDHTGKPSWTDGEIHLSEEEETDGETQGEAKNFSSFLGWGDFIKVEDLDDDKHLEDECLNILCDITVLDMSTTDYPDGLACTTSTMVPSSELPREVLWESIKGVDLEIEVGGVTFPAHKSTLAARSPVFKEELALLPITKAKIHVDGIDADVFKALLHFIYTDTLPREMKEQETLAKMAKPLLMAADRYKLKRMKLICEEALCGHINMVSVEATLAFAEQHCCNVLKEACTQFLADFSF